SMVRYLKNGPKAYYELIRRGGLIFAAVLFCLGMAIIFSKKLNCGNKVSAK
uniref:FXYD domain-containing ion transport regulator n=1 Tax=Sinocyclocheilus anshuiensis TaxID=1608454 RepID=A0A671S8I3_9TELE